MTRIRGCEELADEFGQPGLFLTLTCPSRFHSSTLRDGTRNPKHDGSDPRQAHDWLCRMWVLARAKLARRNARAYGFRVAEPHHDGCTHWHALLWFESEAAMTEAEAVIRSYWLSDDGDEPGADRYRVHAKRMERGGAAGYIAKYIATGIDDHGIEAHIDDQADGEIGADLLGDTVIKPSMRVEAWASHWGIRQFQPSIASRHCLAGSCARSANHGQGRRSGRKHPPGVGRSTTGRRCPGRLGALCQSTRRPDARPPLSNRHALRRSGVRRALRARSAPVPGRGCPQCDVRVHGLERAAALAPNRFPSPQRGGVRFGGAERRPSVWCQ